jgi:hypothetical protein
MFKKLGLLATASIALSSVVALSSLPSSAATTAARAHTVQTASGHGFTTVDTPIGSSSGNAGYIGNLPTRDTASFHISTPTATCTRSVDAPIFVQAFFNGTLQDRSAGASGMYIGIGCDGNDPTYQATLVTDEANGPTMTISAGDILSFTGTTASTTESYSLTDLTTVQTITATGTGLRPQNLQLTVQGGFLGSTVFPAFKPAITYSLIKVNGAAFSALNPAAFYEVDGSGNTEIQTSALSASGEAFGLAYVSNT